MIKGFTSGAMDLLHAGHVLMLKECKEQCDWLVVGLHIDPSTERAYKHKPIETMEERIIRLEGCKYVDEIIPYASEEDCKNLIIKVNPDVRFVGEDWKGKHFTGDDLPVKVIFNSRNHNFSSSSLRERIIKNETL